MEIAIVITNVFLAVLTGFYVALTYRLVNETKKANEQNQQLFEKQFLLSTLPHLHISVSRDESKLSMTIYNSGNIPAYDVDLLIIGIYDEDTIDVPTFMVKYVESEHRRTSLAANDNGFYGVYEHIIYQIFPERKKVIVPLSFLLIPAQILVLLQYKEVSGINYSQVYWLTSKNKEGSSLYSLNSIVPNILAPFPRVEFDLNMDGKLVAANGQPLPEHISKEFAEYWNHSISAGFTLAQLLEIEDRGEWEDI